MKIAVTGAAGFVGRHVIDALASLDVETVAVVRTYNDEKIKLACSKVVAMDIQALPHDPFDVLGRPDALIHLAWGGLPNYRSQYHLETELPVQKNFLKILIESGLPSLLVTGTCAEYGMQSGFLDEGVEAQPNFAYSIAKNKLRQHLEFLQKSHNFNLTWSRLFYTYGEGQAKSSLLSLLKAAVERGDKTFNMSGGEQIRDYLPVTSIAATLVELACRRENLGIVNVCSAKPISVRTLVEGWLEQNAWNIKLNLGYFPYPDDEPMAFWGNDKKLRAILGNEQ